MTFRVGMEVVCVDDKPIDGVMDGLKAGKTYTVRRLALCSDGSVGICLNEILRTPCPVTGVTDTPYFAFRFRPAVKRKTSIEIFTSMLNPSNAKETA